MQIPESLQGSRPDHNQLYWPGRQIFSFPALLGAVLVAKVYWTCRDRIADPDIWWHLRNAQHFVATFRFPDVDTYSFTASGSAWINHEWLSELFYYAAFQAFGLQGIFVLFTSVLAILVVAVFSLCLMDAKDPLPAAIAAIFGGLLAMIGFTPRTQHFGWLCFVAIYSILLRFRSGKGAPLWLIPVLFCVWINCHGSWLIGLSIYTLYVCAGLVQHPIGRLMAAPWSSSQRKKLILIGFASVIALAVNPFGYRLPLYPFDMAFRQKLNVSIVQEWASVDFNDMHGILVAIVLAAVLALAWISPRRWRIDDALLTTFVLYCGLAHIRFLLLAGIVLPPILAPQFGRIGSYSPEREHRLLNALMLAIVVGVCVFGFPSRRMLEAEVAGFFPVRAVEFLRAHPQQGHMFNLFHWGGYIEWNSPHEPTFIDSRTDIFEYKGVLKDYEDIVGLHNSQEILDRYQVNYVLYPTGTSLSYFLSKSPEWERIYADELALIYRRVPQ